jgi:hypothetical protein
MKHNAGRMIGLRRNWKWALMIGPLFVASVDCVLAGPDGTDRPHLGQCDTVLPPTPPSFPAVVNISMTCHFRHLGLTTGTAVEVLNAAGPPSNGVLPLTITATVRYIAANGDELHTTFAGAGSIDFAGGAISFQGNETIVGGAGRFSNASGSSYLEGDASARTLTGFYVTLGTINY